MLDPRKTTFQSLMAQLGQAVASAEGDGTLPAGSLYRLRQSTRNHLNAILQDWQELPDPPPSQVPTLKDWVLENHVKVIEAGGTEECQECAVLYPCATRDRAEQMP